MAKAEADEMNHEADSSAGDATDDTAAETAPDAADVTADGAAGSDVAQEAAPEPGSPEALQARIAELEAALAQQKDQNLRQAAEFDNVRKRQRKDHEDSLKFAQEPLLRDLVGLMDNLQRAVDAARQDQGGSVDALLTGMDMVIKQLSDTFARFGLSAVNPEGEPFDPNRHEAVGVVETDDLPPESVVNVFQTGYLLHERVVRPAMVNVAKPVTARDSATGSTN